MRRLVGYQTLTSTRFTDIGSVIILLAGFSRVSETMIVLINELIVDILQT